MHEPPPPPKKVPILDKTHGENPKIIQAERILDWSSRNKTSYKTIFRNPHISLTATTDLEKAKLLNLLVILQ